MAAMTEDQPTPGSVHDLRKRWKPIKQRLTADRDQHPTVIRFHRACTWLQRVEAVSPDEDQDIALVCQWIAFNALYGQWDEQKLDPKSDRRSWRDFMDKVLALDSSRFLEGVLTEHKRLVMSILDDSYLRDYFWNDPSVSKANQTTPEKRKAATWYIEKRWVLILEALFERVYFLRCQMVHGAATYGSNLNRKSLQRCITMMGHLMPAILNVWIETGVDEDWGPMCYPPIGQG